MPVTTQPGIIGCAIQSGTAARLATMATASGLICPAGTYGMTSPWCSHCQALDHRPGSRTDRPHRGQLGGTLLTFDLGP